MPATARARRRAFTLTEILVAIGIIVLLVGILLPTIAASRRAARRAQISLTLQSISTALDAYKADFGDYPRLPPEGYPATIGATQSAPAGVPGTAPYPWGSQLLCWALLSPANDKPTADGAFDCDGADGPGFRIQRMPTLGVSMPSSGRSANESAKGKVYGPYLDSRFRLYKKSPVPSNPDLANPNDWSIMDAFEHPILYYPAHPRPGSLKMTTDHGYVWEYNNGPAATAIQPLFNATHNDTTVTHNNSVTLAQLQSRLGADGTGKLAAGKQAQTLPYLLWSAGPDGKFGSTDLTNKADYNFGADDVTNLQPQ